MNPRLPSNLIGCDSKKNWRFMKNAILEFDAVLQLASSVEGMLNCCHFEFDRLGRVVDYYPKCKKFGAGFFFASFSKLLRP